MTLNTTGCGRWRQVNTPIAFYHNCFGGRCISTNEYTLRIRLRSARFPASIDRISHVDASLGALASHWRILAFARFRVLAAAYSFQRGNLRGTIPLPSRIVTTWLDEMFSARSTAPLGQRTSIQSTCDWGPRPKCNRGSCAD